MIDTKEKLLEKLDEYTSRHNTFNDPYLPSLMTCKNIDQLKEGVKLLKDETVKNLFDVFHDQKIDGFLHMLILDMTINAKESLNYTHVSGVNIHNPRDYQRTIRQKRFKYKRVPAHPANVLVGTRQCLELIGLEDKVIGEILDVILTKQRRSKISKETEERVAQYQQYLMDYLMKKYP